MKLPFSALTFAITERVVAIFARASQSAVLAAAAIFFAVYTMDSLAGAIYKSVDKDGNIVFTDQPLEGAESLNKEAEQNSAVATTGETQTSEETAESTTQGEPSGTEGVLIAPQPKNPPKTENPLPEEPAKPVPVTRVEILTPIHNATLRDPIDKIWVELQAYPTPMKENGLTAQLWMDDQLIASGPRALLSLPAPDRGTHVLLIKLVNERGQLHLNSEPVTIHVKYGGS